MKDMGKIGARTQENSKLHSPAEQMVRQQEDVMPRHQQDQGKYDLLDPGEVTFYFNIPHSKSLVSYFYKI